MRSELVTPPDSRQKVSPILPAWSDALLRAIALPDELAHSSLRFSFGRFTTADEVDTAVAQLRHAVEKLRQSSPQWKAHLEAKP